MESLLLERLEKEMSYLVALQSVLKMGRSGLKRTINLEYTKGRIDELTFTIDLIKAIKARMKNID